MVAIGLQWHSTITVLIESSFKMTGGASSKILHSENVYSDPVCFYSVSFLYYLIELLSKKRYTLTATNQN